jgi:DedD protein
MDEALKARLIGAAVLVAVAVLLIPELLSGRKPVEQAAGEVAGSPGKRIITIELGGRPGPSAGSGTGGNAPAAAAPSAAPALPAAMPEQSAQGTPAVAPARQAETTAAEPAVATEQKSSAPPAATAVAATEPARATPAPVRAPPPEAGPRPAPGGWAVQVGAFGSVATANGLVNKLQADGYRAFVAPTQRGGKTLHRVRVGPEAQKAGAERLAGQLKAKGLPATVVQND